MSKKWIIISIIVAVVIIFVAVPSAIIIGLHNSTYDCSFNYTKVDDIFKEIARKHVYYSADEKNLEIELNQDLINSIIKDNLDSLALDLPEKASIEEVLFNTENQRLFINAKYGKLNTPLNFKVEYELSDEGIDFSPSDIKLGKGSAPGFIKKSLGLSDLEFSVKYADLDVPQVFSVKDFTFGVGSMKAVISLKEEEIVNVAKDYREDLIQRIEDIKSEQNEIVANFVDKTIGSDIFSDEKIEEYVAQILSSEELVNSAFYFAAADDLEKYSNAFESKRNEVMEWLSPLQALRYYGSVDETVDTILYDEELKQFLTWFVPEDTLDNYYVKAVNAKVAVDAASLRIEEGDMDSAAEIIIKEDGVREFLALFVDNEALTEYSDTANTYFSKYRNAKTSLDKVMAGIESGDMDSVANNLLYNNSVKEFLALFVDENKINDITYTADNYYSNFTGAKSALDKVSASLESGDIDSAFNNLVYDAKIKELLAMFAGKDMVEDYINTAEDYYSQYKEARNKFEKTVADIDVKMLNEFVDALLDFSDQTKDAKAYVADQIGNIKSEDIQNFADYVKERKYELRNNVQNLDLTLVNEYSDSVDEWRNFIVDFIVILQNKDYEEAFQILSYNDDMDIDKKQFIEKYLIEGDWPQAENGISYDGNFADFLNEFALKLEQNKYDEAFNMLVIN